MLADRREFPCQTIDMSPGGVLLFAPVKPDTQDAVIALMEGVEDIPDTALHEGLPWSWESFPEYLRALAAQRYDIDIAALLPHAPLRVYAMGERAMETEFPGLGNHLF